MAQKIRGITIELGADTDKFQKEMREVNKSLYSTEKELKDVDKLLKFDPKNTQLLAQKQDLLKKAIDDTDDKLKKEKEALEQLKKADKSPEVEKQMRALERQIVDDEHKMEKFNDELKDTEKASSGVEKAKTRFKKFGSTVGKSMKVVGKGIKTGVKAGAATIAGVGVAGVAAGKAIGKFASDAATAGDEVDKMSQKLGMSRKGYQEWDFVLGQAGVDINSLQTGMKTMTNQIGQAKNGTEASVETFKKLGISMKDLQGMSREDAFKAIVTSMQGMEDSTERAAIANKLFGKSGQNLTPLFNESAKSTDALIKKANELGMVMGDDAIDAAVNFKDQLNGLKNTFETTKNGIMSGMLPAITDLMGGLQLLMMGDDKGAKQMEQGFTSLFENLGKIFQQIGKLIEPMLNALIKVLPSVIDSLISAIVKYMPTIISALITLVQAILNAISKNASAFSSAVVQIVMMLVDLIVKNLPLILQVGIDAVVAIANGIAEALPDLIPVIISLIMTICDLIIENLPTIIDAGISILMGLLDGIIKALPSLLKYIPVLIVKVLKAIGKILPKLWKFAKQAFKKVIEPFKGIHKWFGDKFKEAWKKIKEKFSGVGKFFGGIWDTIKGKFSEVGTKIGDAIGGTFKSVMNSVLETVENAINAVPNLINNALGAINKLLPKDKQLGKLSTVELPRLAKGGLVTGATNAIIGEGKYNEAVLPLGDPRTVKLFKEALSGVGTGGTVNQTINVGQMSSYREAYLIKRATEQGLKRMMRATV